MWASWSAMAVPFRAPVNDGYTLQLVGLHRSCKAFICAAWISFEMRVFGQFIDEIIGIENDFADDIAVCVAIIVP